MRPRLLDLFCGEGGAGQGYADAGFDVVGVDIEPMPKYPFEFHQADALTFPLDGFAAVHASPVCKAHSSMSRGLGIEHESGWLLQATIDRLAAEFSGPWVVENVTGADMPGSLVLCGSEFGLTDGGYHLRRHRKFVSNVWLMGAGGCTCSGRRIIGVYGDLSVNDRRAISRDRAAARPGGDMRAGIERARRLMQMPWASGPGLSQAIPPAYTRFIGEQLMAAVKAAA